MKRVGVQHLGCLFVLVLSYLVSSFAYANPCVSNASANWDVNTTWTGCANVIPQAGDSVTIGAHTVTIPSGVTINQVTNITIQNGGTLIQGNALTQTITGTLKIESGGTLTHTANTSSQAYEIDFSAANVTIDIGGVITADGKGYAGGNGPAGGKGGRNGTYCLEVIPVTDDNRCSGGGGAHGGDGGNAQAWNNLYGEGGTAYGDITNLVTIGAGGGGRDGTPAGTGSQGGGLILLNVSSTMTINGTITADGVAGNGSNGGFLDGGGAGGAINITTSRITGTPEGITITGGDGYDGDYDGGGGGGGLMRLVYSLDSSSSGILDASLITMNGGTGNSGSSGGSGVVLIKTPTTDGNLFLENGTAAGVSTQTAASLTVDTLTLTSNAQYKIPSGKTLALDTATALTSGDDTGKLIIDDGATFTPPTTFTIDDSTLQFHQSATWTSASTSIITLGTQGILELYDFTTSSGITFSTVTVQNTAEITHGLNTTAQTHIVNISATTFTIDSGGIIDVDGKGYAADNGSGKGGGSDCAGGGAGHGGAGGASQTWGGCTSSAGSTYGDSSNPATIGSGGGTRSGTQSTTDAHGGGLIKLTVSGILTIDGTITADGTATTVDSGGYGSGAGSGGGINITAGTIDVTSVPPSITATGAASTNESVDGGGGGGGLVYFGYTTSSDITTTTITVTGGTGNSASAGSDGVKTITQLNQTPNDPSSLSPATGGTIYDFTPTLSFTLDDPDASESIQYRIQIDDTSDFSSVVVDYTSVLGSEGATSFTVGQAAGSGSYTTGSASTTLVSGRSYYWRVKAIDDSAAASSYSTANSGAVAFVMSQPTVTLSAGASSMSETGGSITLTATLSTTAGQDTTVNLSYSGTATGGGTDYTPSSTSITVTAGATTGTATLTAASDAIDEEDETIITDISSVTNGTESGTQQQTVSITDDDAAPTVALSVDSATIAENGGVATFTATLSAASGKTVTIDLAYSGTATGVDYSASGTSITITAGGTTGTRTVTGLDDALDEDDETVIVDISGVTNGTESGTQQQTTTLTDDDEKPTITLTVDNASLPEGAGMAMRTATFTATLSAASGRTVTVDLAYSGTATGSGTDYTPSGTSITINAGATTGTATVIATTDSLDEDDETVIVDISGVTNGTESGTQQQTTTITDDDATPSVSFSASSQSAAESSNMTVTANLSAASGRDITLPFTVTGTASDSTDYTITSSPVTILAGATTKEISITVTDDLIDENNETVIVSMGSPTNATQGTTTEHTATITDNDTAAITKSEPGGDTQMTEGGATDTFTVQLATKPTSDVTVTLTPGDDCSLDQSNLTFTTSNWNSYVTITTTAVNDDIYESLHSCAISFASSSSDSFYQGLSISITASITDNDSSGVSVSNTGGTTVVNEDGTTDSITIVLSSQPLANATVSLTANTALSYSSSSLVFTTSNWSTPQTVTVSGVDNDVMDGSRSTSIAFTTSSSDTNYSGIAVTSQNVSIGDDDSAGITLTNTRSTPTVTSSGREYSYTLVLTSEPVANVAIAVSGGADLAVNTEQVVFTSSNWDVVQTVTVAYQETEAISGTVMHTLSSSDASYQALTVSSVTVAITDDNTQISEDINLDQTVVVDETASLDDGDSSNDADSYEWSILSGDATLSSTTAATPEVTALSSGTIVLQCIITSNNSLSKRSLATSTRTRIVTLTAVSQSRISRSRSTTAVRSRIAGSSITSETTETAHVLTSSTRRISLPVDTANNYTMSYTRNNRMVLGFNNRVFIANTEEVSATMDVDLSSTDAQNSQDEFEIIAAPGGVNDFGSSISVLDWDSDSEEEYLVRSRERVYFYNSSLSLRGTIADSEEETIDAAYASSEYVAIGVRSTGMDAQLRYVDPTIATSQRRSLYLFGNDRFTNSFSYDVSDASTTVTVAADRYIRSYALGDLNNDALEDLAVADSEGSVYIYLNATLTETSDLTTSNANTVISGGSSENLTGYSLRIADVSGDEINDLVIGAPLAGSGEEGAIHVVFGRGSWQDSIDLESAGVVTINGESAGEQIGTDLLTDDEDEDGIEDIYIVDASGETIIINVGNAASEEISGAGVTGGNAAGGGCNLYPKSYDHSLMLGYLIMLSMLGLLLHKRKSLKKPFVA